MTAWPATTEYAGSSAHLTELMAAIAAGQQDALAQLYHLTRTAVYGLSLSYLKNTHDAQDITQDVFVHVWDHAPQYRPTGSPMGWLLTVCRNLCLMRLRRTERHAVLSEAEWDAIPQQETGLTTEERTLLQHVLSRLGEEERRTAPCRHRAKTPGDRRSAGAAPPHRPVEVSPSNPKNAC